MPSNVILMWPRLEPHLSFNPPLSTSCEVHYLPWGISVKLSSVKRTLWQYFFLFGMVYLHLVDLKTLTHCSLIYGHQDCRLKLHQGEKKKKSEQQKILHRAWKKEVAASLKRSFYCHHPRPRKISLIIAASYWSLLYSSLYYTLLSLVTQLLLPYIFWLAKSILC